MRLSTRSRYGLRMLLDIARNGQEGPVPIKDIAQRQNISLKYLEKLVRTLKDAGYIESKRGPRGGHLLSRSEDQIYIGDIVRVLEGSRALTKCAESNKECDPACPSSATCPTRRIWRAASVAMFETLDAMSLGQALQGDGGFSRGNA